MLKVGMRAPDFTLADKDGKEHRLSDYRGERVVIYFYPKDNTPGCTREACAYSAADAQLKRRGVKLFGISRDSAASHSRFAEKYSLPFTLLSDPDARVASAWGVYREKKLYGKTSLGIIRSTFIVDPDGNIEFINEKVKPDTDPETVLAYLDTLKENQNEQES